MSDLTKLTAEELRAIGLDNPTSPTLWSEVWDRLERLEKCEAAIRRIVGMCGLHAMNPWTMECTNQWCKASRAALEE